MVEDESVAIRAAGERHQPARRLIVCTCGKTVRADRYDAHVRSGVIGDAMARLRSKLWRCDWQPDEFQPAEEGCPYCAGRMCARFDGIMFGCRHDIIERHGYGGYVSRPEDIRSFDHA